MSAMPDITDFFPFDGGDGAAGTEERWRRMHSPWLHGVKGGVGAELEGYADSSGMQSKCQTGEGWVSGYWGRLAAEVNVPHPNGDPTNDRIDLVVLRSNTTEGIDKVSIEVIEGTPAGSPTAPTPVNNGTIEDEPLYEVYVITNETTTIAASSSSGTVSGFHQDRRTIRQTDGTLSVPSIALVPARCEVEGCQVYARDNSERYIYDGAQWVSISSVLAGLVTIAGGTEATAADGTGALQVGADGGANLGVDSNEVQARDGAGSAAALNLNPHGGVVAAGAGGFSGALAGNAATATKLATGRTISLGGGLSGSQSFDGSSNITIAASVDDVAASAVAPGSFDSGDYTFPNRTRFADGSAAGPGLAFSSDIDTGLYRIGSGDIGVSCNNQLVLRVETTGITVTGGSGIVDCTDLEATHVIIQGSSPHVLEAYRVTSTGGDVIAALYSNVGGTKDLKWIVEANGDTVSDTGAYGTISDERLKDGIETAPSYLDRLRRLNVVNYQLTRRVVWDEDEDGTRTASIVDRDEPSPKMLGFSAQQVQAVAPGLVGEGEDGILSVKTTVMVPMLVQAVQEITDRLEALEAA